MEVILCMIFDCSGCDLRSAIIFLSLLPQAYVKAGQLARQRTSVHVLNNPRCCTWREVSDGISLLYEFGLELKSFSCSPG